MHGHGEREAELGMMAACRPTVMSFFHILLHTKPKANIFFTLNDFTDNGVSQSAQQPSAFRHHPHEGRPHSRSV